MKLQLVMLTTVISMITERRVEAQLKCHENRNASGNMFYITSSSKNLTEKIPNGKRLGACSVSPYHIVIFYSEENYFGEVNAVYSSNVEVYRPRSRFIPKSVLIIGEKSSRPTGLFLFRHINYEAGLYKNFIRDDRNIQGAGSFQSAIIIGTEDWKVVRKCKSNYKGECWSCLEAPKDDGASFIQDLKIGFVTEDTIQAYKKNCINIKLTGLSSIPDCPCNQFGVVDGPDKCKGDINGICPCSANFTGDACDSCSNSAHTYREGKCVAGCGCYPPGKDTFDEVPTCRANKRCRCDWEHYWGFKCEICRKPNRKNFYGLCVPPHSPCWFANLITKPNPRNKYARRVLIPGFYNITTGYCKCKKNYVGHCDECAKGFYRYYGSKHMLRCFTKAQYDKVMELKKFHEAGIQDYAKIGQILLDLKNLKALSWKMYRSWSGAVTSRDWIWKPLKIANALLFYSDQW